MIHDFMIDYTVTLFTEKLIVLYFRRKSRIVEGVKLHFYLYDTLCTQDIDSCKSRWGRLAGIRVSVGVAELGDSSLIGEWFSGDFMVRMIDKYRHPKNELYIKLH